MKLAVEIFSTRDGAIQGEGPARDLLQNKINEFLAKLNQQEKKVFSIELSSTCDDETVILTVMVTYHNLKKSKK